MRPFYGLTLLLLMVSAGRLQGQPDLLTAVAKASVARNLR